MAEQKFRHIVRIASSDLDGNKSVYLALTRIKGVGFIYSNMICHHTNIDKNELIGKLDEIQIEKIKDVIANPDKYKVPSWMLNRRKDNEDGHDKHFIDTDLKIVVENDIKRMKMIKSYKGIRHSIGQPVRGQRTRSNFRKNKGKVTGVSKKKGAKAGRV